jgi:hypothetical protein
MQVLVSKFIARGNRHHVGLRWVGSSHGQWERWSWCAALFWQLTGEPHGVIGVWRSWFVAAIKYYLEMVVVHVHRSSLGRRLWGVWCWAMGKCRSCLWRWFVQCSGWFDGRGAANVGCGSRCHTEEFCMKFWNLKLRILRNYSFILVGEFREQLKLYNTLRFFLDGLKMARLKIDRMTLEFLSQN